MLLIAVLSTPAIAAVEKPGTIRIGTFVVNVAELDSSRGTFSADFWIWSISNPSDAFNLQSELEINYLDSKERFNASDYFKKTLPTGDTYQSEKIQGTFLHDYDLTSFPFDRQHLQIEIEDNSRDVNQIKYSDDNTSGIDSHIAIDGWKIEKTSSVSEPHKYATNFGDPTAPSNDAYSRVRITVDASRNTPLILVKMTLGLIIAVMLAIFSCFMPTTHAEIFSGRMLLVGSSLFAIVLNQQFVDDRIGEHTGLTLIDRLHMLGMVTVLAYMILAIASRLFHENKTNINLKRLDQSAFCCGLVLFFGFFTLLIFLAVRS